MIRINWRLLLSTAFGVTVDEPIEDGGNCFQPRMINYKKLTDLVAWSDIESLW